jgi:hypothetical protein
VLALLRSIDGVVAVEPAIGGEWTVEVRPATESARVRSEIASGAVRTGLRLTTLRALDASLDELYRHAVASLPEATVQRRKTA